jgi:tRNA(His) 5'-end guanylyltransferase
MKKKDSLGDRMKERYEDRSRFFLPRRSPVIIRVDGKAFHTFTHGMARPFDGAFMRAMDETAAVLVKEIQGAVCGFVQSDEISVLLCDYQKRNSDAWFDYNVQKMASVAAATATGAFIRAFTPLCPPKPPTFDARCFSIPDLVEVHNYFIWRQKDCERNSIQMVAQSEYSQKQLHGKSCADMHEMLHKKGVNWNNFTPREKRGGLIRRTESGTGIVTEGAPIFSQTDTLRNLIPVQGYEE